MADEKLEDTIRRAREERGWSQHELAQRSGLSRSTIARIETDHSVSTKTLMRLAAVLDLQLRLEP